MVVVDSLMNMCCCLWKTKNKKKKKKKKAKASQRAANGPVNARPKHTAQEQSDVEVE